MVLADSLDLEAFNSTPCARHTSDLDPGSETNTLLEGAWDRGLRILTW